MSAQDRQDSLLLLIAEADDAGSGTFFTASGGGTVLVHEGFLPNGQIEVEGVGDLKALAARGLLAITEHRQYGDVAFVVTPDGHQYADQLREKRSTKQRSQVSEDADRSIRARTFASWRETGEWPHVSEVQREAERAGEIVDVDERVRAMGYTVAQAENGERRVSLKVRGFADLEGAEPYLEGVLRAVRLLYQRYASRGAISEVTDQDFRSMGYDDDLVRRLYQILDAEGYLFGGGGARDAAWHRSPSDTIRHFRSVQTIDDYLAVLSDLANPKPKPPAPPAPIAEAREVPSGILEADPPVAGKIGEETLVPEIWGYEIEQLVSLPREDLGLVILRQFKEGQDFHPHNVGLEAKSLAQRAGAATETVEQFEDCVGSACVWLKNQGYVVDKVGTSSGWERVSRSGAAAAVGAPAAVKKVTLLSGFTMDARLSDSASSFEGGRWDAAVTLAMKQVEIAVRTACGLGALDIGDNLMTKAFQTGGILEDPRVPAAENIGRRNLFAGAVGWLRNPAGHRQLALDPQEAAEILLFANYLLRVTDEASADKAAGWPTS